METVSKQQGDEDSAKDKEGRDSGIIDETISNASSEPLILYGLGPATTHHRRGKGKNRLPGPLKLPKNFKPKQLTAQQQQILGHRLSQVPQRWNEGYGQEVKKEREYKAKTVSNTEVARIVRRLSKPVNSNGDDNNSEVDGKNENDHELFSWGNQNETETTKEWKLKKYELERMIDRLSRLPTRNVSDESTHVDRQQSARILTANDIRKLTERLNKPKVYQDTDVLPKLKSDDARFVGARRLKPADVDEMVERIAYKGIKLITKEDRWRRAEINKWSSWTQQDADYSQWKKIRT
eukprot:gene9785-10784_t